MSKLATDFGSAQGAAAESTAEPTHEEMTYLAAINAALHFEMGRDANVLVIGEDVADPFGGAFKVTKGLSDRFGMDRVINTPISENGFIGMASGMALIMM